MKKLFDALFSAVMFLFAYSAFGYGAFHVCSEWFRMSIKISACVACATSALIPILLWRYTYYLALQVEIELQQAVNRNNVSKVARS